MALPDDLGKNFAEAINYGSRVRFKYFSQTFGGAGSYYDDDVSLAQSGSDLWVSGLVMPLSTRDGSRDGVLLAQGRVRHDDRVLYLAGSIQTSGTWRVGIGSPPTSEFCLVPEGVTEWSLDNTAVYKKMWIRWLGGTGSLEGE